MPGISICAVWGASALGSVAQDDTLRFAVTSLSFIDEQTKIISDLLSQGNDLLDGILSEKRRVADAPLVEKLLDAGVAFPNDPLDPTNAALTQSPIVDILSQGGLSLFAGFDNINRNLESLQARIGAKPVGDEGTAEAPDVPRLGFDAEALSTLAQEGTLLSVSGQMDSLIHENRRIADAPLPDMLSELGISLLTGFDNIDRNLQTLFDAQLQQAQGTPDLSVIPGTDPSNPMYIVDVNRDTPRKVEIVNTPKMVGESGVLDGVRNPVDVKQVGVVQVSQGGEFVVQLASGGTLPVRVEGGRMVVDIAGGLEGLAVNLADTEVGLRAVGAI